MSADRKQATRRAWLETIAKFKHDPDAPGAEDYWSPSLDCVSRDELAEIQGEKLRAAVPFLYENSDFYRRRFERLGATPDDLRTLDGLAKWPPVDKQEMMEDVLANPPYGTYSTHDDALWAERGWMLFSSSGSTGPPRVFRYSQLDRDLWAWANARAMHSMGIRPGDTVFLASGYGPHVWAWGVQFALAKMGVAMIPGGGMDGQMRARIVERFAPSVLSCTPSYALYLGRTMQSLGLDPAESAVTKLFIGGEPATGIKDTRERLEALWNAETVEFYGCTEAAPHTGGYSCPAMRLPDGQVATHLMEDLGIWELVDDQSHQPVADGTRGLTVCTNLNSESSPQLRFLVGDYTVFDHGACACGRTHVRAIGCFAGRADDLINLRGIKMYPVQIEAAVRAVPDVGDEFEILLQTNEDGLDVMTLRVEHPEHASPDALARRLADEIRGRCEVRADVQVLAPDTLPKTQFKAKRVRDERKKI